MTAIIDGTNGVTTPNVLTSSSGVALTLQSSGTTAVTIDTSQNVGIGTTSPVTPVTVATTGNFSGNGVRVVAKSAPTGYFTEVKIQNDGTVGSVVDAGGSSNNYLSLQVQSTEKMRVLSTGNILCLSGGSTTATGTGIAFPATQSASSDANTLDDYEEGTWSPSLGGNTTYTAQQGYYTKIGRLVVADFELNISSIGTGSTLSIAGLPYASGTTGNGQGGSVGYFSNAGNAIYFLTLRLDQSSTAIALATLTAIGQTMNTSSAFFQSGTRILGTITYQTA